MRPTTAASVAVAASAFHSLSWQALPPGMQGTWLNVSQWVLVWGLANLAWACATARSPLRVADSKTVAAAVAMVLVDNAVGALCSAAWLIDPWVVEAGQDQCTKRWGIPVTLITGAAYAVVAAYLSKTSGSSGNEH